jgi:hypothetical protein
MSTATLPSHRELAASITANPDRLADLYRDATQEYERLLEKLDEHAASITDTMTRVRASIARSRETGPSALSLNGLGELQGQARNSTASAAKCPTSAILYAASAKSST